jgi:putative ABC transport system ATP-binding protein
MQLRIQNLLPSFFKQDSALESEVWRKDLLFEKGELIKIVAPSGKGKSSLMNFLYGMRDDYNGKISYDDHDFRGFDREQLARYRKDHISIVFQDLRLFPNQSVFDNIEIKRQLNPFHASERIREMTARLGIEDKLDVMSSKCSYGEQQRVAIIRALMQPFDILLLDEPFSHLDEANAEKAMNLMLDETRLRNAAIVFADLERIDFYPYTKLYHL